MLSREEIRQLLNTVPKGYLEPENDFFKKSNTTLLQPYKKLGAISSIDLEIDKRIDVATGVDESEQITCNVVGCQSIFDDIISYQRHYNIMHRYHCAECKKSLPTEHLLDIHITEQHDSFFAACVAKGNASYKCLIEECKIQFQTPDQRNEHCIKDHNYPANFRFNEMPIKKRQKHHNTKEDKDETEVESKMDVDNNTNQSQTSNKIKSYSFGRQKTPTFKFKKQTKSGETLEKMDTLKHALDDISN